MLSKKKTGTALRRILKMFNRNHLPHELLLTTIQKKQKKTEKCI